MRAVVLRETGPAENLQLEADWPRPALRPGHVLVRVRAVGVCHRDVIDRKGGFPFMKKPVVPGHEFAGDVVEAAGDVREVAVGDRVVNMHRAPCGTCHYCKIGHTPRCTGSMLMFGLTADGGYAEYVLAGAASLVPLPADVAYEEGCFLYCTAGIALRALRTRARVAPGETVLIAGASGGVGLHALQIARALGAHPIAVTSSADKVERLESFGAEKVIVSPDLDFHKRARAMNVQVVFDCVGAPTLHASIRSVQPMGRVVVAGNVTISRMEINPGYFILNEIELMGVAGATREDLEQVLAWVADGTVRPVLLETLPLDQAAAAHRRLEARNASGRLVLIP